MRPSHAPTAQPSGQPLLSPTSTPSTQPTRPPTLLPSLQPTKGPTAQPTSVPTRWPSLRPTAQPSEAPRRSPSLQPVLRPSAQPSENPSRAPSRLPTAQPYDRPTALPTTYLQTPFFFLGETSLANTSASSLDGAALSAFRAALAQCMSGVRSSDILVVAVERARSSAVTKNKVKVEVDSLLWWRRLHRHLRAEGFVEGAKEVEVRLAAESNLNTFVVAWNLTIILQALGYASGSEAYTSLTSQVSAATASGEFAADLASLDAIYRNVSVSSLFFDVLAPTAEPTAPPPLPPPPSGEEAQSQLETLSLDIGVAIGAAIAAVVVFVFFKRRHQLRKAPSKGDKLAAAAAARRLVKRGSLELTNHYPKRTTVEFADNPTRINRQPKIHRNVQKSYL